MMRATRFAVAATLALVVGFAAHAGAANAATYTGSATAYASCDGSTSMTASGRTARLGYVANNWLPLGTWIEMVRPKVVQGRTFYRVYDRGGPGFALDFWTDDCSWMHAWGRRTVTFRAVPKSEMYRGKPYKGYRFTRKNGKVRFLWRP